MPQSDQRGFTDRMVSCSPAIPVGLEFVTDENTGGKIEVQVSRGLM
jgi:hypothetical protein